MSVCADWYACIYLNVIQVNKTLHGTQYIIIAMFVCTYSYIFYILRKQENNNSMKSEVVGVDII